MPDTPNLPFLRALKCAYKLHKAGLNETEVVCYLIECKYRTTLPSAATPVADLLPASFNFAEATMSQGYWQEIQDRLFNKVPT